MQSAKEQIITGLKKIVKGLTNQDITSEIFHPKDERYGDYSSNIALTLFGKVSKDKKVSKVSKGYRSPLELAEKITETFNSLPRRQAGQLSTLNFLGKVEAVKPGFINFWLSKEYLLSNLKKVLEKKEYGSKPQDLSKKVVVEYSSPNIAKPFTVGHLRSTIIGDAIANLLETNGWKVYRDNHLGDWGTQFGKQIYAIKTWGNEEKIEKSQNPVKELVSLYVKFHEEAEKDPELGDRGREWFKKLENGDAEARRLWEKCVNWSLKEFKIIFQKLGVKFTENNGLGYGESFFEGKIKDILEELKEKKLLKESEGAKLVFFLKDKYPPLMIIKKDGATLYATRDLATDKFRLKKYGKDVVIINEVGIEQSLYFRQLFELEKMLGWIKDGQRIHKRHGHYRFKDEKMSTRKGNTIWLEDVLEEAVKRAEKLGSEGQEVAKKVGIGAIKWNDLKRASEQDIVFDWDDILNMQGDSGPYLQYVYARTQSVLAKAISNKKKETSSKNSKKPFSFAGGRLAKLRLAKLEPEEVSLLSVLSRFPEVVEEAGEKFAPSLLCNYLFDLAQKFNLFYQKHKILESKNEEFRINLTMAVGQILKNGLNLLGIQAPDKM